MVSGYDGKGCLIVLNTLQLELVAGLNDVRDSYGGPHTSKKNGIGVSESAADEIARTRNDGPATRLAVKLQLKGAVIRGPFPRSCGGYKMHEYSCTPSLENKTGILDTKIFDDYLVPLCPLF